MLQLLVPNYDVAADHVAAGIAVAVALAAIDVRRLCCADGDGDLIWLQWRRRDATLTVSPLMLFGAYDKNNLQQLTTLHIHEQSIFLATCCCQHICTCLQLHHSWEQVLAPLFVMFGFGSH